MKLSDWLDQQKRKSNAVQTKVDLSLEFMRHHYDRENKILSELKCIDFSKQVKTVSIPKGTLLIGYKDPRVSPYKSAYFTKGGTPTGRLGISSTSRPSYEDRATGKKYEAHTALEKIIRRYEVLVPIPRHEALMSYCAPAADTWSVNGKKVLAAGGGIQYLIPRANRFLKYDSS